jgi:hypothetical protein
VFPKPREGRDVGDREFLSAEMARRAQPCIEMAPDSKTVFKVFGVVAA